MEKVRVYDLARELGLTNKELIDLLAAEGFQAKSHSSCIDGEVAVLVKEKVFASRKLKGESMPAAPAAAPADGAAKVELPAALAAVLNLGGAAAKPEAAPAAPKAATKPVAVLAPGSELHMKPPIVVRDLADALGRKPNELIGVLMGMNVFATISQVLDVEVVEKICTKYGIIFTRERREKPAKGRPTRSDIQNAPADERVVPRPPVVAFLGHVDHGKTSLQDAIRKTHVAKGEVGGITQGIGASVVTVKGQTLTMLDTPGHEAFTAMRARGANATDIVILVVAADDGIMPQTIEAINHARAAKVPIIVAMNKIDLPGVNTDRVLVGLQSQGINPEEWGGDVGVIRVSAITGQGLEDLLERILLEAEVMEIKGNPKLDARGVVVEAQMESGMGPTANILVRNGTLHVGDILVCGKCYGKIKALIDYHGKRIKSAGPSTPVKAMGLSGVPEAGDMLEIFNDEREAKQVAEERQAQSRNKPPAIQRGSETTIEDLFKKIEATNKNELRVILKTDVRGSAEAISESLNRIVSEKVSVSIVNAGVGEITENDIMLASTTGSLILGFHVRAMPGVNATARRQGVDIRLYSIIYELLDDINNLLIGKIAPETRETIIGKARIIQVFDNSKAGKICGSRVDDGAVRVGANARVKRGDDVIYKGRIQSLRRFQDDVREVKSGLECGIRLDNFEDFEVGDQIEVFTLEKIAGTL
ncbi:MAG: translation initiation factor IF-2 [Lentisphaeria bacterium]